MRSEPSPKAPSASPRRGGEGALELGWLGGNDAHALAASPGGGFDQQRECPSSSAFRRVASASRPSREKPSSTGTPTFAASALASALFTHPPDRLGGLGPMKTSPSSPQRSAKLGVLGQEAVARMDRLGADAFAAAITAS